MLVKNNGVNSGVQALSGFAFQRNSAIYLLLDNYDYYKNKEFFICIEHHDDLIFALLNDANKLCKVEAYQAKKASKQWATSSKLAEIIAKITLVGSSLKSDQFIKSKHYTHNLTFLTNHSVKLTCGKRKDAKTVILKEDNTEISMHALHDRIQDNIKKKVKKFSHSSAELNHIRFLYVDLNKTDENQRLHLAGMLSKLFRDKITDPYAAMDLLLTLFRNAETIYNQAGISSLLDPKKRINSLDIYKALDVITKKRKAFSFWRSYAKIICSKLKIPVSQSSRYKEHIDNCFDFFKDLEAVEFRKIYKFVDESRAIDDKFYDHSDCIIEIYNKYLSTHQTQLTEYIVLFAIVAAFVETRNYDA